MATNRKKRYEPAKPLSDGAAHGRPASSSKSLQTFQNQYAARRYWVRFEFSEFGSKSLVSARKEPAKITVEYIPDKLCVERGSLELYLATHGDAHGFNEETVKRLLDDLVTACRPREAIVHGEFAARSGISICEAQYPGASRSAPGVQWGTSGRRRSLLGGKDQL